MAYPPLPTGFDEVGECYPTQDERSILDEHPRHKRKAEQLLIHDPGEKKEDEISWIVIPDYSPPSSVIDVDACTSPPPPLRRRLSREEKIALQRRRSQKHLELLKKRRAEREAREEEEQETERRRLILQSRIGEQPFLFLPDEVILHIFREMPPVGVVSASRVCKRFRAIARDQKLWQDICTHRWGELAPDRTFKRNNEISWQVTFRNNYVQERRRAKMLATLTDPIACRKCGERSAAVRTHQRNVQYIQWTECVLCGECWDWNTCGLAE